MQVNGSILMILVIACFLGSKAIPFEDIKPIPFSNIIWRWPIYLNLCGSMGTTCQNATNCCKPYQCGYPSGYNYTTTRCCGIQGSTGCTMIPGTNGKGCCSRHYCTYIDSTNKRTVCREIIYKK
jgi:hypothetical protein